MHEEQIACVRCGDDLFAAFARGDGRYLVACSGCGYRRLLRKPGEESGDVGRCLECGSYFEVEAGITDQVCSEACGHALTAGFNALLGI